METGEQNDGMDADGGTRNSGMDQADGSMETEQ